MPRETWQERKAREDAERDVVLAKVPEVARILGGAYTVDEYLAGELALQYADGLFNLIYKITPSAITTPPVQ